MVNVLYWILPGGQFAGCSKPIEGCISDRELLIASGLKEELEEGDEVEADRGFANCQDVFAEKKARIITPAFKPRDGAPFPLKEVFRSETIARSRIHIGKGNCLINSLYICLRNDTIIEWAGVSNFKLRIVVWNIFLGRLGDFKTLT